MCSRHRPRLTFPFLAAGLVFALVAPALAQRGNRLQPDVPVIPVMGTGATDSRELRKAGIAAYGVSGLFEDINDNRAHGKDERIGIKQFSYDNPDVIEPTEPA